MKVINNLNIFKSCQINDIPTKVIKMNNRGVARGAHAPLFSNHLLLIEELQTVLFEVELIIDNALLTYVYPNIIERCLTPNHLLFGKQLLYSSNTTSTVVRSLTILSSLTDRWIVGVKNLR